jgi:hypothetical protein
MRLVTIDSREVGGRPGAWLPTGEILDLVAAPGTLASTQWLPQSVVSVLAQGEGGQEWVARLTAEVEDASPEERRKLRDEGRLVAYSGTALLAPVRRPGLLLVTRVTGGFARPRIESAHIKNPHAAVGPDAQVEVPGDAGTRLDLSVCLGLVLGRSLFQASPEAAGRAIAAYTLLVDLGLESPEDGALGGGRQFPGACPIGPAVISPDEFDGGMPLMTSLRINGHPVAQTAWEADPMAYGKTVSLVSAGYALRPGDIIALAPPEPPAGLGAGDKVAASLGSAMTLNFSLAR